MPLYTYRCNPCKKERDDMRRIEERHDGPQCDRCRKKMFLQISPVAGVVVNPAAPRQRSGR